MKTVAVLMVNSDATTFSSQELYKVFATREQAELYCKDRDIKLGGWKASIVAMEVEDYYDGLGRS